MEHYNRSFCHSGDLVMCLIQLNLFEREEFHYGPVFAVEEGIEELVEEWR